MNKTRNTIIGAIVLIIIVAISFMLFRGGLDENENDVSEAPASDTTEIQDDEQGKEEVNAEETAFTEILFDTEPTMYGRTDYFSLSAGKNIREMREDFLKLEPEKDEYGQPKKYYLGHQIYISGETGEEYIYSGNTLMPISFNSDDDGLGYMREEETGRRIHMFGNTSDVQNFLDSWDEGQAILNGTESAPENAIIFDGCLTPYFYSTEGNEIYFNLSEIAPLASSFTYYEPTMGYIDVYVNDFTVVQIPTNAANEMLRQTFNVVGEQFTFRSWNGESFTATATVLDALDPMISLEDASLMFGWHFYTDGNALSIVTDPLNATSLAAVRQSGDMGLKIVLERDEDGTEYARAYDAAGNVVWEEVFDESLVQEDMTEEDSQPIENS